jgi:hypothetical protein
MYTYNFPDHYKGDTFEGKVFTLQVNDEPAPLEGASIKMDLRKNNKETTPLTLRLSTGNGITILNPASGIFSIDNQMIDIPAETYVFDIQITFSNQEVKTYVGGTWTILQDVTHG